MAINREENDMKQVFNLGLIEWLTLSLVLTGMLIAGMSYAPESGETGCETDTECSEMWGSHE